MIPPVSFAHLARLTTSDGLYEHAEFAAPRTDHGYCVDDVGRGLVVASRQVDPSGTVRDLERLYLDFLGDALDELGRSHNRRNKNGRWIDKATTGDHWGRSLWGLGTAASRSCDSAVRDKALVAARRMLTARSHHPRAMAYAAVGAGEVLRAASGDELAISLLRDTRALIGRPSADTTWPWPQARLGYANGLIPEALLVIGTGLDDPASLRAGLDLLDWLVDVETRGSHLSVTPTRGWSRGEERPAFDQQPIEVAALAEAAFRAWEATGAQRWTGVIDRCAAWFTGSNDIGLPMYDRLTGGGYDGLLSDCVNLNQGAESTLAAIATFQLAHSAALALVA